MANDTSLIFVSYQVVVLFLILAEKFTLILAVSVYDYNDIMYHQYDTSYRKIGLEAL